MGAQTNDLMRPTQKSGIPAHPKMALQPPKKNAAGFFLAIQPPAASPSIQWDAAGQWVPTQEWSAWAQEKHDSLLETLLAQPKWFSKPPRRDVLAPLFSPWDGKTMQGVHKFFCTMPEVPETGSGSAVLLLQGLMMSSTAINPVWSLDQIKKDVEAISLFDDGETVDSGDEDDEDEGESREIRLEEIDGAPGLAPTRIRSREWETKKFLSKERVREARLKAQIAVRMARSEEARFFRIFGDLEDAESNFSDYDLSGSSEGESE